MEGQGVEHVRLEGSSWDLTQCQDRWKSCLSGISKTSIAPHMLVKEFEEHSDCDGAGFMSLYPITRFVPLPNILIHNSVPCCKVSITMCYARTSCS